MKPYLIALAAGVLAGIVYGLINVRSPAPPVIALVGLMGILIGEQLVPVAKRLIARQPVIAFVREDCAKHVLGHLPTTSRPEGEDA